MTHKHEQTHNRSRMNEGLPASRRLSRNVALICVENQLLFVSVLGSPSLAWIAAIHCSRTRQVTVGHPHRCLAKLPRRRPEIKRHCFQSKTTREEQRAAAATANHHAFILEGLYRKRILVPPANLMLVQLDERAREKRRQKKA